MKRISLPDSFEARFVLGRALFLVPVLTVLLLVFFRMESPWRILFAIKYVVAIALATGMAIKRAHQERIYVEKYHEIYLKQGFWDQTDTLPISVACVLIGVLAGLFGRDWRWIPIGLILGGLIWIGLVLRWITYNRWLNKMIRARAPR